MKFIVLASGSKGNATYFEHNDTKFLIDCGITYKQLSQRLSDNNLNLDNLESVFITHEHSDHIDGLGVFFNKHKSSMLYMSEKSLSNLSESKRDKLFSANKTFISNKDKIILNDIVVTPFSITHDCADPFGYTIEWDNKKIVYLTDTGIVNTDNLDIIHNAEYYIIESNHDPYLLMNSSRPHFLKERIYGIEGHLSNEDCAYTLTQSVGENTKGFMLAHLSEECNDDEIVLDTIREVFDDNGYDLSKYEITVCRQDKPTKIVDIN